MIRGLNGAKLDQPERIRSRGGEGAIFTNPVIVVDRLRVQDGECVLAQSFRYGDVDTGPVASKLSPKKRREWSLLLLSRPPVSDTNEG